MGRYPPPSEKKPISLMEVQMYKNKITLQRFLTFQ